jgi:hypothetical protein
MAKTTKSTTEADTDAAKRAARKAAIDRLIENHGEEFAGLMREEHTNRGVTWNRRLTDAERAERDAAEKAEREEAKARREAEREQKALDRLLAQHPGLAERIEVKPEATVATENA